MGYALAFPTDQRLGTDTRNEKNNPNPATAVITIIASTSIAAKETAASKESASSVVATA